MWLQTMFGMLHGRERLGNASRMTRQWRRESAPRQMRRRWTALSIVLSLAGPASRAQAQDTSVAAKADSMAARLEALERSVKLLREQLAAQAGSAASSRSRSPIEFSGRILLNAFYNKGRSNNVDVPTFAVPAAKPFQDQSAGASFRQTILSLSSQGAKLWGADASGMIETDFFGGVQTWAGGRQQFSGARLRIARAMLTWETGELMIGQDVSLITPIIPVGLSSLGEPSFSGSGHLWSWLPQIRATKSLGESGGIHWALQGALVAPWGGSWLKGDVDSTDIGERSRKPFVQARLRARWGEEEMRGEIGVGGHYGWLGTAGDSSLTTSAVAVTWQVPLVTWAEVRGEWYTGQMLQGLGDGGAGQNFGQNALGKPIPLRDTGGWVQVNVKPDAGLLLGLGLGQSQPTEGDLPDITRNALFEAHAIWRPGGLPVVSLEVKEIQTTYRATGLARTRQVNLGFGVEF